LDVWGEIIGRSGDVFDPLDHLERTVGRALDRDPILARRRARHLAFIEEERILPGVMEYTLTARELGLGLAVASSSPPEWVNGHLERLGIHMHWDAIVTYDGSVPAKPAPDLYLAALRRLGAAPHEAIAFEDSRNGVAAAKAAGMYCVAVPNPLTAALDLSAADLRLSSLGEISLPALVEALGETV
jgi:HAD superfamily hydrolase (TIGR01509 family)